MGRKAVIMTHCLNGWLVILLSLNLCTHFINKMLKPYNKKWISIFRYVVKTVDNAESIKLQHCSLAKTSDNSPAKVTVAEMAPSWL